MCVCGVGGWSGTLFGHAELEICICCPTGSQRVWRSGERSRRRVNLEAGSVNAADGPWRWGEMTYKGPCSCVSTRASPSRAPRARLAWLSFQHHSCVPRSWPHPSSSNASSSRKPPVIFQDKNDPFSLRLLITPLCLSPTSSVSLFVWLSLPTLPRTGAATGPAHHGHV